MKKILVGVVMLGLTALAHAVDLPGPVVSAEWLSKNKDQVQVIDVRSDAKSATRAPETVTDKKTGKIQVEQVGGYIPSSLMIEYSIVRSERMLDGQKTKYLIPEKDEIESRMRAAGARNDKPFVLVGMGLDSSDISEALRLYWTLKVFGEDRIAILDGGLAGWIAQGYSVSTAAMQKPAAGDWTAKGYRAALVAGSKDVEQASQSKASALIDGRDPSSFYGVTKRGYVSGYGHIQGAVMLSPEAVFRPSQGALYFLTKAQYQALAQMSGIDSTKPAITYCNSGNLAATPWFVMYEMLGNAKTSLYDGSLYLWSRENRPMVGVLK